ncbi:Methyltransferase domain-containing protein [Methylomagnum ishizawai]|uniref:Methyltransferase domain-containing protein n=1 Tax=Methylomagnum ishizawai TaxID=1760988 RepID=A0A1Y6DAM2_9GAMM|nr:class I SAM-dependent methyltransferase [Methylomagnum ishizawai]SMF97214.1 Methyltransferase domain-containing protein [Methylomagnum ishizawai]
MNTLATPPLAPLLVQLFADADVTKAELEQRFSPEDRDALIGQGDYRELYTRMKDVHLAVSKDTGKLLYLLARSTGARSIIEFGTSFGISTLHLAAALRDNGCGHLISTEFEPSKVARARENLMAANLSHLVEIREGDALETLAHDLPETIDLVLLDGAKPLYSRVLTLLETNLRAGALIIADNADWSPDYLAKVRSPTGGYFSVPFASDVELSMKLSISGQ